MALFKCGAEKSAQKIFGDYTYISHKGLPQEASGPANWDVELDHKGRIKSFSVSGIYDGQSYGNKYKLFARKSTSDGWTQLATGVSPNSTTNITDNRKYKYIRLQAYNGPSYGVWQSPYGNYWYLAVQNFVVNYKY